MKSTTAKFKQIMASGEARRYLVKVDLTLANTMVLHLTEQDMWEDSFSIETASSGTSSFDIGSAIIGQCKFSLNNFNERFSHYDFFNATAVVWLKLDGDTQYYRMGFYTVDEPTFAGALIQLILLDNMWKFDIPLSKAHISYTSGTRALNVITALCSACGVTLNTQRFHGYDFPITEAPEDTEMNCREMLQYVAMLGCNFCYIDEYGDLNIKWYDVESMPSGADIDGGSYLTEDTPYSDGDDADGGNFRDYTSGDSYDAGTFSDYSNVNYFTRNFNLTMGTDVITITGLKVKIGDNEYTIGTDTYMLVLDNPLITENNYSRALNSIWEVIGGFKLRTFNVTTASDLAVEIGDCCVVKDYKENFIYSWVTNNVFKFSNHIVQCNAVAPNRQLTTQYSKAVQIAVEQTRRQTDRQLSDYDIAVQRMNQLAANAAGLYWIEVPQADGTSIYYESNRPLSIDSSGNVVFTNHSHVWKHTGDGFFQTANSGTSESNTTWTGGIDANNNAVMNTIATIGLTADWIKTGTLTLGGQNNTHGVLVVNDRYGNEIGRWDNNGIEISSGTISSVGANSWVSIDGGQIRGGYGTTVGNNPTYINFHTRFNGDTGWIGLKGTGVALQVDNFGITRGESQTALYRGYSGYAMTDIEFTRYRVTSDISFEKSDYLLIANSLWIDFNNMDFGWDAVRVLQDASWNNHSVFDGMNSNRQEVLNGIILN